jgi:hypothetical protein
VFGDLTVLTPPKVIHYPAHATCHSSGSYYLIGTHQADRFDGVFGTVAATYAA